MRRAITIKEARELSLQIMKDAEARRDAVNLNDVVIPGDTWTSGKILPVPENDRQVADDFLVVRKDTERISIGTYWFDGHGWADEKDNVIYISAWRRIPMDGIDEAVRLGDAE